MPSAMSPASLSENVALPVSLRREAGVRKANLTAIVSRRPGREQGMALEALGHAVEYLIDSRMFLIGTPYTRAEEEAVQILMGASRSVFEGCPRIVPLRTRLAGWLSARLGVVRG